MATGAGAEVAKAGEKQTALSDQWIGLARNGQETLAETVAEFVATVERVVPVSAGMAKQREVIESGLAVAHAIARAPYSAASGLLHNVALVNLDVETVNVGVDTSVDVDVASREPGRRGDPSAGD
jgi:hypothetical protein